MFYANGKYTVMRGVKSVDEYGDTPDTQKVVARGVIGSVVEKSRQVYDPNSQRLTSVRMASGRFDGDTDLQVGDRIRNEKTKALFVVDSITFGADSLYRSDVLCDLLRNDDTTGR